MTDLPDPIDYSDYQGRRNIDDKLDEVITTINQLIEFLKQEVDDDEQ